MLLKDKTAVIHGGGGAIGGAMARAFAREGARVFLAGRTKAKLDAVAADIRAAGGAAETAVVDVLDLDAVRAHAGGVVERSGRIDIAANAVGFLHVQGIPLEALSLEAFERPLQAYTRAHFIVAKVMGEIMGAQGSGVILTISTPGSKVTFPGFLGYGTTCSAVESFSRILAAELGGQGVRVVCLRPDAIPETLDRSHVREIFAPMAEQAGARLEDMLEGRAQASTFLKRLPRLDDVAEAAAFYASDRAGAATGVVVNLTGGSPLD
ncbi:SDR family NAD(P)-dependent oxidoreductase [Chthonobacter albigriseus]|uniref:SDR family NAD(P)-dependent oxidoreductase n=1 Tax=Chthonobacter albigriseus TaxID=1683161 RepID=UPI0015EE5F53|nr:SDR family oxidoreductase [Chthonobacter albigriseus]